MASHSEHDDTDEDGVCDGSCSVPFGPSLDEIAAIGRKVDREEREEIISNKLKKEAEDRKSRAAAIEKYTADAKVIYKDVVQHFTGFAEYDTLSNEKQMKYLEDLLEYYQAEHPRFATTFPIVLRYMVQIQQYDEKAFVKYLKRLQAMPYKTEEEYCQRQSEYIMYLHMAMNPKSKKKENQSVRKEACALLVAEVTAFKDAREKAKEKQEKNNGMNNIEKRAELKKLLAGL